MGRRRRKTKTKGISCIICQNFYSHSLSIIPRCLSCVSQSRNTMCDSCVHRHVLARISQNLTSEVICPENNCNAKLNKATIQVALVHFGHQNLWNDYVERNNWSGTSEQWIRKFTVKCPYCQVAIEKNGGCDHMNCTRCKSSFNWTQAKDGTFKRIRPWQANIGNSIRTLFCRGLVVVVVLLVAVFAAFLFRKRK